MKKLFLFLISSIVFAADTTGIYLGYQEASLSSSAQKVTIQQIASGTRDIQFSQASLWCSAATTFSLSRTGTAATATTATPLPVNSYYPAATAHMYTASDVGSGSLIKKYDFQSGQSEILLDLSAIFIPRNAGTTGNLTISTTSITGTCRISFLWKELK